MVKKKLCYYYIYIPNPPRSQREIVCVIVLYISHVYVLFSTLVYTTINPFHSYFNYFSLPFFCWLRVSLSSVTLIFLFSWVFFFLFFIFRFPIFSVQILLLYMNISHFTDKNTYCNIQNAASTYVKIWRNTRGLQVWTVGVN